MTRHGTGVRASLVGASVILAAFAAVLGSAIPPVSAASAPPGEGPITVVIPATSSPSPSPGGTVGSGGSSGSGSDGSSGDGTDGGTAAGCAATNADGSPVPPAQVTENAAQLAVDKDRLAAGEWVIASASGFTRGEKAQVVLYPGAIVIGSYTVDAPTGFVARFRIPEGTPTGLFVLEATGWQSCHVESGEVTVVSAPAVSNSPAVLWVFAVLGTLGVGAFSLSFAFRADIAAWFGGSRAAGSTE